MLTDQRLVGIYPNPQQMIAEVMNFFFYWYYAPEESEKVNEQSEIIYKPAPLSDDAFAERPGQHFLNSRVRWMVCRFKLCQTWSLVQTGARFLPVLSIGKNLNSNLKFDSEISFDSLSGLSICRFGK